MKIKCKECGGWLLVHTEETNSYFAEEPDGGGEASYDSINGLVRAQVMSSVTRCMDCLREVESDAV